MIRLSKRVRRVIELLLIALLVVLFILLLDLDQVRQYISAITLRVVLGVLSFQFLIQLIGSIQWALLLREAGIRASIVRVFWVRVSGSAVTYLTPSMYFGGEPVRAALLKTDSSSYQTLYATIALDKYVELFTKGPFIIAGFTFLISLVHEGLPLLTATGVVLLFFIGLFIFVMIKLLSGGTFIKDFFKAILRPVAKVRMRLAVRIYAAVKEFSRDISRIIRRKRIFYLAMVFGMLLTSIEVLQTYYILKVLEVSSIRGAFIIYSSVVVQGLLAFFPANIGGMEGTHLFFFNILGMGSTRSLIYTIILRIGQMSFTLLGILYIMYARFVRSGRKGADRIRTGA